MLSGCCQLFQQRHRVRPWSLDYSLEALATNTLWSGRRLARGELSIEPSDFPLGSKVKAFDVEVQRVLRASDSTWACI